MTDEQELPENPSEKVELAEIFSKDPTKFEESDIKTITTELRRRRTVFAEEESKAKSKGKKLRGMAGQIKFEELDLGID